MGFLKKSDINILLMSVIAVGLSSSVFSGEEDDAEGRKSAEIEMPGSFENLPVDKSALAKAKATNVTYGPYLRVLRVVYEDFLKFSDEEELKVYVITIEEDEKNYVVNFKIPYEYPVLGDGSGKYVVNKQTYEIVSVEFSR